MKSDERVDVAIAGTHHNTSNGSRQAGPQRYEDIKQVRSLKTPMQCCMCLHLITCFAAAGVQTPKQRYSKSLRCTADQEGSTIWDLVSPLLPLSQTRTPERDDDHVHISRAIIRKIGHIKGFQMPIFGRFEPRVFPRLDTKCTKYLTSISFENI